MLKYSPSMLSASAVAIANAVSGTLKTSESCRENERRRKKGSGATVSHNLEGWWVRGREAERTFLQREIARGDDAERR